jgi:D-glycero-alpha-D-manno-heptose 1-phosphate guanylyltransferase
MVIKEAIILAGGLGTRLRDTVPDLPKCMAPVAGRPFLFYVINELRKQGIEKFVFSLGYKHEVIEAYLKDQFATLQYQCSVEAEPLGTGGAIRLACEKTTEENVLVANGDTLFRVNVDELAVIHLDHIADTTLALKPMENFDRYGIVQLNEDRSVNGFREKQFCTKGLINGGIYLLNKRSFLSRNWPEKFSFEKEYLESGRYRLYGSVQDQYFIDIGIPEDYEKAQKELQQPPLELGTIDKNWTLFLDRDGVINEDKQGSYIFTPDEFIFTTGAPALFKQLTSLFNRIIVTTNQRGVGRGLMTEEALTAIHNKMKEEIKKAGGKIDAIYYCTSIHNDHPMRKPNPGMALQAKADFPDIELSKSIMIGNNPSDMLFGRNAGMYTVFVKTTRPNQVLPHPDIDVAFDSLAGFAAGLRVIQEHG